jgi:hypothetical protein
MRCRSALSEPARVYLLDELELPGAIPLLHLPFPNEGGFANLMQLVPDERRHGVLACEAGNRASLMLPHALLNVVGHADV